MSPINVFTPSLIVQQRRYVVIGVVISGIFILAGSILHFQNQQMKLLPRDITAPIESPPEYLDTGGVLTELEDLPSAEQQEIVLLQQIPIETATFTLEYDFARLGFTVYSELPANQVVDALQIWLEEHDFGDIPLDRFEFSSI